MEKKYLGESHRKYSIACQKEVEEMLQHPLTQEQFQAQIWRNAIGSEHQGERNKQVNGNKNKRPGRAENN